MPDVQIVSGPGRRQRQALPKPWTYFQAPGGILLPDGELLILHNGGGPGFPESDWLTRYPAPGAPYWVRPEHVNLWSGDELEGETGLFGVCRTPESWPADRRWLLAWSGAWSLEWGKAYRVWVGLATAPAIVGPWTRKQAGIVSVKRIASPAANPWWPPGVWAAAPLVVGERVLVVVRDSGTPYPGTDRTLVYELAPDLTATLVGSLHFSDEVAKTWATDLALGADGRLYVLDGGDPGQAGERLEVVEHATAGPWAIDGVAELKPTGRRYAHPRAGVFTWDAAFLRTPAGGLLEPRLVLANAGLGANWAQRGRWWLQFWDESDDGRYAERLAVEPLPHRIGPPRELVATWGGAPELVLDLVILGPTSIEWDGESVELEPRPMQHAGDVQTVRPAALWPAYLDAEYRRQVDAGERVAQVTVRGTWWGSGRRDAPGGGIVYPLRVEGEL